ncbi:ABC transporter permease subunit [Enterococcus sp. LJL98]
MTTMIKFELKKITKNFSFLGAVVTSLFIMFGIYFTGFHYSQLSLVENSNENKGVENLYWDVAEKHSGTFDDNQIKNILSDYIELYQSKPVSTRPFDLFSSNIADIFFPSNEDTYIRMNEAVEDGNKITIDQVDIPSIKEIGFSEFKQPLKIGNYVPWSDLYKVSSYIFLLSIIISILICSLIFSSETSRNINQLLISTQFGRTKLTVSKILSATITGLLIFIFLQGITLGVFSIYNHGFSGWDASIQTNFSLHLFDFSIEMNNLNIWFAMLLFYVFGLLSVIGITLLISSLTTTPFSSLIVSLSLFMLPLALTYIFKEGIINKLLYLFPINNFNTESLLTLLSSGTQFFLSSFWQNFILVAMILLLVTIASFMIIYWNLKNKKNVI